MKTDEELKKIIKISTRENIIFLTYTQESSNEEDLRLPGILFREIKDLIEKNKIIEPKLLIDLTILGNDSTLSSQARKNYAEMLRNLKIYHIAVVGGNTVLRTIASFIIKFSNLKTNLKWFDNIKEAFEWLKK